MEAISLQTVCGMSISFIDEDVETGQLQSPWAKQRPPVPAPMIIILALIEGSPSH
jgi:hypothetical protein